MATMYRAMRGDTSCRGSVFLLAMVSLVTLLLLGTSLVEVAINGLSRASRDVKLEEAGDLAEAGVDMAMVKLYEDYDSINETLDSTGYYASSFTLPQGTVNYTVTAPYSGIPDTCMIVSEATSWANRQVRVRVLASYRRDVNRVFEGAIFSDSPLTLNGAGGVYPDASGKGGAIYSNGNITFNGTSFTMTDQGAIYTTGTTNWVPPQVPATSVHQQISPIPMPVIDLEYYRGIATHYYSSSQTFNSSNMVNLSGVIFVEGNVNISGTYTGQALIVATGNIKISGNVTAGDLTADAIALISPKAVKITGSPLIHGLIYSHSVSQDATMQVGGNVEIYGAVVSDVVTTNGGIIVRYRDVWAGLPIPGKGKTQWARFSWEQHAF